MALDEAASALESPRGKDLSFRARSVGDTGVETAGNFDFWGRDMMRVNGKINQISPQPRGYSVWVVARAES